MPKQLPWLAAVSSLGLLLGPMGLLADTPAERATLRGLGGVRVIVDGVPPELAKHGVRTADLQADRDPRQSRRDFAASRQRSRTGHAHATFDAFDAC